MRLHIKIGVPHPVGAVPAQATWQCNIQRKVSLQKSDSCPVFQHGTSQASGHVSILACLIRHMVGTLVALLQSCNATDAQVKEHWLALQEQVDVNQCKATFPYGLPIVEVWLPKMTV